MRGTPGVARMLGQSRRTWDRRRLTTRGTALRPLLVGACVLVGLLVVAVVHVGTSPYVTGRPPLGGQSSVPGYGPVPTFGLPLVHLSFAVAAACFMAAVHRSRGLAHWAARALLAFVGVDWGVEILFSAFGLTASQIVREQFGSARWLLVTVSGTAVAAAVAVAVVPRAVSRTWPWLLPSLAAVPFASWGLLYVAVGARTVPATGGMSLGPSNVGFPEAPTVATWLSFWTMNQVSNLRWGLLLLVLWQAHEAGRAARDLGLLASARSALSSWTAVLAVVLTKAAVWTASCAGWLSWAFGDGASVCKAVTTDGAASVLLAILMVGAAVAWLWRQPFALADRRTLLPAGMLLVAALMFRTFLGNWAIRFDQVVRKITFAATGDPVNAGLSDRLGDNSFTNLAWVVLLAAVAGLVLLRTSWQAASILFLAFAVWNGVRAVAVVAGVQRYPWMPWRFDIWLEVTDRPGWVDPLTLDVVITAVVATAALRAVRSGVRHRTARGVAALLIASTVLGVTSHFRPALFDLRLVAVLLVVFPVAYTLLFDAQWIVDPRRRSARVAGALGLSVFVLALVLPVLDPFSPQSLTLSVSGYLGPLAQAMLIVPVLAAAVMCGSMPGPTALPLVTSSPVATSRKVRPSTAGDDRASGSAVDAQTAEDRVAHATVNGTRSQEPGVDDDAPGVIHGEDVQQ